MPDPTDESTELTAEIWAAAAEISRIRIRLRQTAGDHAERELDGMIRAEGADAVPERCGTIDAWHF